MTAPRRFLAFDLGAESGRVILGDLAGGRLALREVRRFPNRPVRTGDRLCWDLRALFEELLAGLAAAAAVPGPRPESLAVDAFGVDFALLGADGAFLGPPVSYRDGRTAGAPESFFRLLPRERVYELTGIQTMPINTLFQLHAMVRDGAPELRATRTLLFIPDAFGLLLTGRARSESTIASTSQMYDPRAGRWSPEILRALGLPASLLPEVAPPGTLLGPLRPETAARSGLPGIPVVAAAGHDTACAVAAVPSEDNRFAYVSSGTWSLVGVEVPAPVISPAAMAANLTNEGGAGGRTRLLRNVAGLWLVMECRRAFGGEPAFEELEEAAAAAPPFAALLDPDWPGFLNPPDMPAAIGDRLRRTGQREPPTRGGLVRCILESLALKYRVVLDRIAALGVAPVERVHVVGGGSRSALLSRFTAEAAGLPVLAGPAEATAAGNLLLQAAAAGAVEGLAGVRAVSWASFPPRRFEPRGEPGWEAARTRMEELVAGTAEGGGG